MYQIAQDILNLYPDSISQFGLIGCAFVTFYPPLLLLTLYKAVLLFVGFVQPWNRRWYM